tara:strand:+ start:972 stop:1805 length:834 start_codon:yes stop_codon:yes gene_type:complete
MSNEITLLESQNVSTGSLVLSSEKMNSIFKVANIMSQGVSTVPKHLQGNPADCMAVIIQATQWNMNPFAVAQKTHVVSGTLGYESQLVNAVVSTSGAIISKFKYEYQGDGLNMSCRVGAILKGENDITWNEYMYIRDVKIQNSPLWKTNPKQQIAYLQVKNWTRLYAPECILGVYYTDELANTRSIKDNSDNNEKVQSDTQKAYDVEDSKGYSIQELLRVYKENDLSVEMMKKFNDLFGVVKTDPSTYTDIVDNFDDYFYKFQDEVMNSEAIEAEDE